MYISATSVYILSENELSNLNISLAVKVLSSSEYFAFIIEESLLVLVPIKYSLVKGIAFKHLDYIIK